VTAPVSGHVRATPKISGQYGIIPGAPAEQADPCTMVIFGATGDLTKRKLFPALYQLAAEHLLHPSFAVLAVGREPAETDATYRERIRLALVDSDEVKHFDDAVWQRLAARTFYAGGDASDASAYAAITTKLAEIERERQVTERNRFFYLAVPPSVFETIVRHLSSSGLVPKQADPEVRPWARLVVEKPFGHSLETAKALNALVLSLFAEHQVYRIDHYLGKETVQNVLVFRFANSIFEPLWNRRHISHVQITAAEEVGVEARGRYYEEAGVVRDMFQNHLLQLLALTAMEPPPSMTADAVRDEKVKVLRLGKRVSEIAVQFHEPPHLMFGGAEGHEPLQPNTLVMRVQPNEGISLSFEVKVPGAAVTMTQHVEVAPVEMDFTYAEAFGETAAPAYETLLLDVMIGEMTLFLRSDEVEAAWKIIDPLLCFWDEHTPNPMATYAAGSWGPREAEELIAADGAKWRMP
jgi:glucose-6-phosphate 1-dehydrogenase